MSSSAAAATGEGAQKKSPVSTHVLDTSRGVPAAGIPVSLEIATGDGWSLLGQENTNSDGRCTGLLLKNPLVPGLYRLSFDTLAYLEQTGEKAFFPRAQVDFVVADPPRSHYHVPLLLSPYSYTTYRGS